MRSIFLAVVGFFMAAGALAQDTNWVKTSRNGCQFSDPFPTDSARYEWTGACLNGTINGNGIIRKWVGSELIFTYEGDTKNGFINGKGKVILPEETTFEGIFVDGELLGQGKIFRKKEELLYEGEIINYKYHGVGQIRVNSEYTFSGIFRLGKIHTGTLINSKGERIYYERGEIVKKAPSILASDYSPILNKEVIEYFDKDGQRTTREYGSFFRKITYEAPNTPKGLVKDYEMNGTLRAAFYAKYLCPGDASRNFYDGYYATYHPNGEIHFLLKYRRGELGGVSSSFYESGEKETVANYRDGQLNGVYMKWFPGGKLNYYAFYEGGKLYKDRYYEFDEEGLGESVGKVRFREKESVWSIQEKDVESFITETGSVQFRMKNDKSIAMPYQYVDFDKNKSFRIKINIAKEAGKGGAFYGLIFGYKDSENFNEFVINSRGAFYIYAYYKGIKKEIKSFAYDPSIKVGNASNELSIYRLNEEMYFTINGNIVHTADMLPMANTQLGCLIVGSGDFELRSIELREMLSEEETSKLKATLSGYYSDKEESDQKWSASGSGFFISENGLIATNYHVVEDGNEIVVEVMEDGKSKQYPAKLIASDPANDLAILKIDEAGFYTSGKIPYSLTGQSQDVGTTVFTLGYPHLNVMGKEVKYNKGEISSKTGAKGDVTRYQISVPIQPGNSGGPLFDEKGNLVGIVCSKLASGYQAENVNYAIKSAYLKSLIESLPERVNLKYSSTLGSMSTTDRIKVLSKFIPIILVR